MKKLKLFAGFAMLALSCAVFAYSNTESVSSVVTLSEVEALAGCEASETCGDGTEISCSADKGGGLVGRLLDIMVLMRWNVLKQMEIR